MYRTQLHLCLGISCKMKMKSKEFKTESLNFIR